MPTPTTGSSKRPAAHFARPRSAPSPFMRQELAQALRSVVGHDHVLTRTEAKASYERDFTGRYGGSSVAVVRPGTRAQVAKVVEICSEYEIPIVPQGGNTGVVGGGVPRGGDVLVSMNRLDSVGPVDLTTGQMLVGAGTTLAAVQKVAKQTGWEMPLDLGARDAATVGGLVATDAGGSITVAHGTMRERVAGLAAVMPDGAVVARLQGLRKDNAGYLWPSLLIGSEGTLGIVTDVLLRLVPLRSNRVTALFAVRNVASAIDLVSCLRRTVPSIEAADFFLDDGVDLVQRTMAAVKLQVRRRASCYVIVECAAMYDPIDELSDAIDRAGDAIIEQAAAIEESRRRKLWELREALPEALIRAGIPVKIDVAVPIRSVADFVEQLKVAVTRISPETETVLWGHLGDGNVHVNVLGADGVEAEIETAVLRLAASLDGTISAEHGVGISKARHLGLIRSSEEIALLRAVKSALDPTGLMNPGVVLPG